MSWKYRPDETDVIFGEGAPTATVDRPTLYLDRTAGSLYSNNGGGSTWSARAGLANTRTLTAGATLTSADSGKTIFLNAAGGGTVTLPANSTTGFHCRFVCTLAPTTTWAITAATADTIAGSVFEATGAASDTEAAATGDAINFIANTAVVGDQIDVVFDGTSVFARGFCSAAGGITITG